MIQFFLVILASLSELSDQIIKYLIDTGSKALNTILKIEMKSD